jgi:menaquinone-dependent protoporphyrinogen oxidase
VALLLRPLHHPAKAANHPWEVRGLVERLGARGHRAFGGRLDLAALDRREWAIIAVARGRQGDHRDLDAVGAWGAAIGVELSAQPAKVTV